MLSPPRVPLPCSALHLEMFNHFLVRLAVLCRDLPLRTALPKTFNKLLVMLAALRGALPLPIAHLEAFLGCYAHTPTPPRTPHEFIGFRLSLLPLSHPPTLQRITYAAFSFDKKHTPQPLLLYSP